ncbi:MAG: hypothetical protein BACD_02058 [Bacteroides rodentium]|jgi:hypothetical protein
MATKIKAIPTLKGKGAKEFLMGNTCCFRLNDDSSKKVGRKLLFSSYSYIYILYICTHINDFKLKEKQYG